MGGEGTCDHPLLPVELIYPQSQQRCQERKGELSVLSPGTEAVPPRADLLLMQEARQELRLTPGIHLRLGCWKGN